MTNQPISGTQGYAEQASGLINRYRHVKFEDVYAPVLSYFPIEPCSIVDIGAGVGQDSAYLAQKGHRLVAIEPTKEFRESAKKLFPSPRIEWLNDSLPNLSQVLKREETFDVVLLNAVWMHLDEDERYRAMPNVSKLTHQGSKIFFSLRHGIVPQGRRMFEVSSSETIKLAKQHNLRLLFETQTESIGELNNFLGVTWSKMVFERT